jgi:hypothetical protein
MLIVKIGGPAYRIGMGGGAASSIPSGSNRADLDFNAVQVCSSAALPVLALRRAPRARDSAHMGHSFSRGEHDLLSPPCCA